MVKPREALVAFAYLSGSTYVVLTFVFFCGSTEKAKIFLEKIFGLEVGLGREEVQGIQVEEDCSQSKRRLVFWEKLFTHPLKKQPKR